MPNTTKHHIAHIGDLQNGEMKAVHINDDLQLVLAKINNTFYAVHGFCTHYGAPLAEGALNGHRLVCPWHQACFDIRSGKHLEAPGLDGIPSYPVAVEGEEVFVEVPESITDRIPNTMSPPDTGNKDTYVILGAGAAGAYAIEGMRQAGFTGKITMITKEKELPYDRPNCSKAYLSGDAPEEWMPLRDERFYQEQGVELVQGRTVKAIDTGVKIITFDDGDAITYDKLLVCTGGQPRQLPIEGTDLEGVYYLRSLADSRHIREAGKNAKNAVVIGSSFIGLEATEALQKLDCQVTVVAPDQVPFEKVFGQEVGRHIQQWHESAGVAFRLGRKPQSLHGNGKVQTVRLDNGEELTADLVIIGIGVRPNTDFLRHLSLEKDGGLQVDQYLKANEDVYAAGDIAYYPFRGTSTRIEHWKVAAQQGRVAGMNMAGAQEPYNMEPFFWTAQQGKGLRYAGHHNKFDETIIDGNLNEGPFLVFYLKENDVQAVLGSGRDAEMAAIRELLRDGRMPSADQIRSGVDWASSLM